jgi:catechol 2,3-dioxygenase-like lactoylglutathione lyase family enzyme
MYFEHFALNVPDPRAMADWYVEHCGLRVVHGVDAPPYMRFLADVTGRVIMEIYNNPQAPVPDYAAQSPLMVHVAYAVDDMEATKADLIEAGATLVSESHQDNGSVLVMMRDPWGIPLQLVKRGVPIGA